jgi:hypothetical protein
VLAALGFAANSSADTIVLRDGTEHEGEVVSQSPESVTLRVRSGGNFGLITLARRDVSEIKCKPLAKDPVLCAGVALQKEAEAAATDPKKAAQAWVRVGEYYNKHVGYSTLAHVAFEKALAFDPEQPVARAQLGFEKTERGWEQKVKPAPKVEQPKAAPAQQPVNNEMVIGLRRDDALIKKLLDEQAARKRAENEPPPLLPLRGQDVQPVFSGYARDYFYVGPYGGVYYYAPQFYGVGGVPYYPAYGGYGYGCGSGYGIGFGTRIGSGYLSGSFYGGSSYYRSTGAIGVMRYGF